MYSIKIHQYELGWFHISLKVTFRKKFRITQKIIFYKWIVGNPEEMFWFDSNNLFWSSQWNGTNIEEYCFPPQNEPHTAKQNFSGIFKHFCGKYWKLHILFEKRDYHRNMLRNTQIIFSQALKRGKSWGKYWFWMEHFFWSNQWNGTNIDENGFPHQNKPHTATHLFCCFEVFSRKLTENFSFWVKNVTISERS